MIALYTGKINPTFVGFFALSHRLRLFSGKKGWNGLNSLDLSLALFISTFVYCDISDLINEFEVITRWPKKRLDKEYIIKYLSEKFQPGTEYSEKEVNSIIKKHHTFNDVPLLRRELISKKYLSRIDDCSIYWKN